MKGKGIESICLLWICCWQKTQGEGICSWPGSWCICPKSASLLVFTISYRIRSWGHYALGKRSALMPIFWTCGLICISLLPSMWLSTIHQMTLPFWLITRSQFLSWAEGDTFGCNFFWDRLLLNETSSRAWNTSSSSQLIFPKNPKALHQFLTCNLVSEPD